MWKQDSFTQSHDASLYRERIFSCQNKKCLLSIFQLSEFRLSLDTFSWQQQKKALNNFESLAPQQGQGRSCNYMKCITIELNAYEFLTLEKNTALFLLFSETNKMNALIQQQPE